MQRSNGLGFRLTRCVSCGCETAERLGAFADELRTDGYNVIDRALDMGDAALIAALLDATPARPLSALRVLTAQMAAARRFSKSAILVPA